VANVLENVRYFKHIRQGARVSRAGTAIVM